MRHALARQNTISKDDQHLLGTLLVNELLTAAFARPEGARQPFFLCVDEFANFVTKDMCEILDGGRKFGLHLILAHQFLNQLKEKDPEVYFSTLINARTKAVFGGLDDEDLDILAKELYTGEFDPDEIKDEIWQTKLRPVESIRTVHTSGSSSSSGDSYGEVSHQSLVSGEVYIPGSGFLSSPYLGSSSTAHSRGSSSTSARQSSYGYSDSIAEVPWYEYHEYKELSSRTFRSLEEQLYIKKAQLKRQSTQHAAILIPDKTVELIRVATLRKFTVKDRHREEFKQMCFVNSGYFKSQEEALAEVAALEARLLAEDNPPIVIEAKETATTTDTPATIRGRTRKKASKPYGTTLGKATYPK